ncbi:hypothetical protein GGTG_04572 [Gaeumannomyces tritici R3-111a-1]|uniref:Uncharacterized protein n=1 Tax=Gaeumannomyces tritici (strain R3-111a-1) TaxID=644352 RepID=J3NTH3_GAET3|nr:hypothetical protein GGTG_04572 [Gaeumannomyces tritici R3-111a-1]EJT79488.1 hypothetical protein GGTG_04572 [Gaeumannomyces tritici R3-111a-1]
MPLTQFPRLTRYRRLRHRSRAVTVAREWAGPVLGAATCGGRTQGSCDGAEQRGQLDGVLRKYNMKPFWREGPTMGEHDECCYSVVSKWYRF